MKLNRFNFCLERSIFNLWFALNQKMKSPFCLFSNQRDVLYQSRYLWLSFYHQEHLQNIQGHQSTPHHFQLLWISQLSLMNHYQTLLLISNPKTKLLDQKYLCIFTNSESFLFYPSHNQLTKPTHRPIQPQTDRYFY